MRIAHVFLRNDEYYIPFDDYEYDTDEGTLTFYLENYTTALFNISYVKYFVTHEHLEEDEIKTDFGNHAARDNVL